MVRSVKLKSRTFPNFGSVALMWSGAALDDGAHILQIDNASKVRLTAFGATDDVAVSRSVTEIWMSGTDFCDLLRAER